MVEQHELLEKLSGYPGLEWYIAMETDRFLSRPISSLDDIETEKLIELRAFNKAHEIKAVRGALGEGFQLRDSEGFADPKEGGAVWPQTCSQFLDIDTSKGFARHDGFVNVHAIGGGEYGLPSEDVKQVEIENYYRPDEKGFFKPFDFRIVGFL